MSVGLEVLERHPSGLPSLSSSPALLLHSSTPALLLAQLRVSQASALSGSCGSQPPPPPPGRRQPRQSFDPEDEEDGGGGGGSPDPCEVEVKSSGRGQVIGLSQRAAGRAPGKERRGRVRGVWP